MTAKTLFLALSAVALAACGGSDDPTFSPDAMPEIDSGSGARQFELHIEAAGLPYTFVKSGTFSTPEGGTEMGPIFPGDAYSVTFSAAPGARLSFETMFGPSNDFFYAPGPEGIALYDDEGEPISGDVTDQVSLWDAGTEINQEPGCGADVGPNQAGANTGAVDPVATVRLAADDFDVLPDPAEVLKVTLTPGEDRTFSLRIENVSSDDTLVTSCSSSAVPLAPGVWAIHTAPGALFADGEADRGDGLEAAVEDGNPASLAAAVTADTGLIVPLSPGVWAIHTASGVLFTDGEADRGDGLESLAESGNPSVLAENLASDTSLEDTGTFSIPDGSDSAGAIVPGGGFTVTFSASPGDRLSFATMFGLSNDAFYAPGQDGIELFDGQTPRSGDITAMISLWDAGTEVDQEPGIGPDTGPQQASADAGAAEGGVVHAIDGQDDGQTYPATDSVIRVTLTPM